MFARITRMFVFAFSLRRPGRSPVGCCTSNHMHFLGKEEHVVALSVDHGCSIAPMPSSCQPKILHANLITRSLTWNWAARNLKIGLKSGGYICDHPRKFLPPLSFVRRQSLRWLSRKTRPRICSKLTRLNMQNLTTTLGRKCTSSNQKVNSSAS